VQSVCVALRDEPSDQSNDPLLQHLVELTREGTIIPAFQAAHDKFRRYQADCVRLAASATSDDRALDELRRTLDAYAELFNEHHYAEDNYLFPALRGTEPGLDMVVEQLAHQHVQLAVQLAVVLEHAKSVQCGERLDSMARLTENLRQFQIAVDEHLLLEETTTVPVVGAWTRWPV
jgi:hemerythrin-like domain-containing protein